MKMQVFVSKRFQNNLQKMVKIKEILTLWPVIFSYCFLKVDLTFHDLSDTLSPKMPEGLKIKTMINTTNDKTS